MVRGLVIHLPRCLHNTQALNTTTNTQNNFSQAQKSFFSSFTTLLRLHEQIQGVQVQQCKPNRTPTAPPNKTPRSACPRPHKIFFLIFADSLLLLLLHPPFPQGEQVEVLNQVEIFSPSAEPVQAAAPTWPGQARPWPCLRGFTPLPAQAPALRQLDVLLAQASTACQLSPSLV